MVTVFLAKLLQNLVIIVRAQGVNRKNKCTCKHQLLHLLIFTPLYLPFIYSPSSSWQHTLHPSFLFHHFLKQNKMGAVMRNKGSSSLVIWALVAGMLSQNLVIPVVSTTVEDQKNYYPPDPHAGTPPSGHGGSPPGGSYGSTPSHTPSHGSHNPPSHGSYNPPSHGSYNPTPSPPSNCGTPPHNPTPSTPSTPTYHSPPSSGGSPPIVVTPPTPVIVSPPIPVIGTPPIDPGTPGVPAPPYLPNPNSPPFTCIYWRNHPTVIWGLVGWWATLGHTFGLTSLPGFGSSTMNLQQALSNTRADGLGELYRQGTAALLNSMVDNRFHFSRWYKEHWEGSNNLVSRRRKVYFITCR